MRVFPSSIIICRKLCVCTQQQTHFVSLFWPFTRRTKRAKNTIQHHPYIKYALQPYYPLKAIRGNGTRMNVICFNKSTNKNGLCWHFELRQRLPCVRGVIFVQKYLADDWWVYEGHCFLLNVRIFCIVRSWSTLCSITALINNVYIHTHVAHELC